MIHDLPAHSVVPPGLSHALENLRAAWDAGDAHAYASLFEEDATYVIYVGQACRGRAEIERVHEEVFTKWQRGSRMALQVVDCRLVRHDVAVLLTEGGVGKGPKIHRDKLQTFTWVHRPEGWRCASFQNTRRSRWFSLLQRWAGARQSNSASSADAKALKSTGLVQ
jgi:uncharacterized protein (TIGR02246 family)